MSENQRPAFKNRLGRAIRALREGRRESRLDLVQALGATVNASVREVEILEAGRQTLDGRALFLLKKIAFHFGANADNWLRVWAADAGDAELEKGGRG